MSMVKKFFTLCVIVLVLIFQPGCTGTPHHNAQNNSDVKCFYPRQPVSLTDKGSYYDVTLDFSGRFTHRQVGEAFAREILSALPDYEALVDSYIAENLDPDSYSVMLERANDLKPQLQQDYTDEIEGMARMFSGKNNNVRGDNKISRDEFYVFNLFPDVARGTQCSFVSVFGSRSASHGNITGRILDWYGGNENQLPKIQAIIRIINPHGRIWSIGYLGYMGIISGFNDDRVFAAILDSQSGAPFTSVGKRSYPLDLRYALEHKRTLNQAAGFMKENATNYTVNHLIAFSDPKESKVLENNFSGTGPNGQSAQPALRDSDSRLNDGVTWDISNAIGCVNSFILYGNLDNHTNDSSNTQRWDNMKTQLQNQGSVVSFNEIKDVISYNHGFPGNAYEYGDLYNDMTLQMIMFQPGSLTLEVFFRPKESIINPVHPVFEKISVF